jgi:nucleoside 2-deoxyribosyltransferase
MANPPNKSKSPAIPRPSAPILIPHSEIYFKTNWNARDVSRYVASGAGSHKDGTDVSAAEFSEGMAEEGQKTPIDVRPNPWPKESRAPYAAVTGFRRGAAIALAAKTLEESNAKADPKDRRAPRNSVEAGQVIAYVHEDMTEAQAVVLNAVENLDRLDLASADVAFNVWRIADAIPSATHAEIGRMVGRSQPVISQLMKIKEKVVSDVRQAWRQGGEPRHPLNPMGVCITIDNMIKVAEAPVDRQAEVFQALCAKGGKQGGAGRGNWIEGAKSTAAEIGSMLGTLQRLGHIDASEIDWPDALFGEKPGEPSPVGVKWHKDTAEISETGGLTQKATEARAVLTQAALAAFSAALIVKSDEEVKAEAAAKGNGRTTAQA